MNGKVEWRLFNGTLKSDAGGHAFSYPFRASAIEQNMSKYHLIGMIWMNLWSTETVVSSEDVVLTASLTQFKSGTTLAVADKYQRMPSTSLSTYRSKQQCLYRPLLAEKLYGLSVCVYFSFNSISDFTLYSWNK